MCCLQHFRGKVLFRYCNPKVLLASMGRQIQTGSIDLSPASRLSALAWLLRMPGIRWALSPPASPFTVFWLCPHGKIAEPVLIIPPQTPSDLHILLRELSWYLEMVLFCRKPVGTLVPVRYNAKAYGISG